MLLIYQTNSYSSTSVSSLNIPPHPAAGCMCVSTIRLVMCKDCIRSWSSSDGLIWQVVTHAPQPMADLIPETCYRLPLAYDDRHNCKVTVRLDELPNLTKPEPRAHQVQKPNCLAGQCHSRTHRREQLFIKRDVCGQRATLIVIMPGMDVDVICIVTPWESSSDVSFACRTPTIFSFTYDMT